jgi:hypothetical protein
MNFDKILIAGCSYTSGYKMSNEHHNPATWANQLSTRLGATSVKNIAKTGANNQYIFLETVSELIKDHYDLVLIEWSAIPRYRFKVGLELYSVDSLLSDDVNLVGHETISKKWLQEIKHRLLKIHNDHWDITELIKYINVLTELQTKSRPGQIFFINGLAPWPDNYFTKKQIVLPSDLDDYTQNLLQVELRDDSEIFQLYDMIHNHYITYGGIQHQRWLNLYCSMDQLKIDIIDATDTHPGTASQSVFADYFYQQLEQKLNYTGNAP